MSQPELVRHAVDALNATGIEYMLTGSLVSSYQGLPRSTHDADFVIKTDLERARKLLTHFPAERFYTDEQALADALKRRAMFNILSLLDGDKIDMWLLTPEPFDQTRFSRRQQSQLFGCNVFVSSPEDTILMKLKWARDAGGSEKQLQDALSVYDIQYSSLDKPYLQRWAATLNIADSLAELDKLRATDA